MSLKNGENKICTVCFSEYYVSGRRADSSKFCSKRCWEKRRVLSKCEFCGGDIKSYYGKKYCSRKCSHKAMFGESAARWKDGKSLERDRARLGSELKQWRNSVYERDNYTCRHCGNKGIIHAHHIIEWAADESKRFDVDNGLTLCIGCHGKIHGKDFSNRGKKKCPDCDKQIKKQSERCRKCSAINQWKRQKTTVRLQLTGCLDLIHL